MSENISTALPSPLFIPSIVAQSIKPAHSLLSVFLAFNLELRIHDLPSLTHQRTSICSRLKYLSLFEFKGDDLPWLRCDSCRRKHFRNLAYFHGLEENLERLLRYHISSFLVHSFNFPLYNQSRGESVRGRVWIHWGEECCTLRTNTFCFFWKVTGIWGRNSPITVNCSALWQRKLWFIKRSEV